MLEGPLNAGLKLIRKFLLKSSENSICIVVLMGLICKVSQWSHIRLDAAFFGFAKDLTMESEISTVAQHHSGSEGKYNLIDTISIF